jgi:hypothetical protein
MKIISDKQLRVATLSGAVLMFEAGVVTEVADEVGLIALQLGAKEHNKKHVEEQKAEDADFEEVEMVRARNEKGHYVADDPSTPDVNEAYVVKQDDELINALKSLIEEANPSSFKTDGTPKANVVNKLLGRTIRSEEREAAWEKALNS